VLDPDGRRTQKGMTTTAQPRVQPGVPSGGEFTAVGHSDTVPSLDPAAAPAGLVADADTSWMTEKQLEQYNAALQRLRDAGVEGRIAEINTYDGEDFDYVSPEGTRFHLIANESAVSIWRQDEDELDEAHCGSSQKGRYGTSTPRDIAEVVDYARSQARIADAWVQATELRSNDDIKFYLPVTGENPSGEYVGMLVETAHGSFDVRTARGTHEVTVAPQNTDQILSPRMTQAFLEDVTDHSKVDPTEVAAAMTRTIATATGADW
jgi:hypothetical protein